MQDTEFTKLETNRLFLRRFHVGDRVAFNRLRNIDSVAQYQSWPFPYSTAETNNFIRIMMNSHPGKLGEWFQFVVALKSNGNFVGDIGLKPLKVPDGQFMLGYSLFPECEGQGLMSEALIGLINYAFTTLGQNKALAYVDIRNERSIKVLERLNFQNLKRWENFGVEDSPETLLYMSEKSRWTETTHGDPSNGVT